MARQDIYRLVRTYAASLFLYSVGRLRDRHLAEDAVQEIFLRAHRAEVPDDAAPWLFGVARHCCQEIARRRKRAAEDAAPLDEMQVAAAPEGARPLGEALEGLDDEETALVQLKHGEGLTCREIAERTGRPLGTVTSALARAYGKLRSRMTS